MNITAPMNTSILIVEDEGLIAADLKEKLEDAGYAVPAIADNASTALGNVEHFRPSLVLMDIRLKGSQDGIETADQIRREFDVPVIFVTSHADTETLKRARISEPFGYVVKPFSGSDLRAQIEMALWKHQMEQKLRASEAWLSATFRNVADALIATDSRGNVALMNTPAATLTGWESQESAGKPLLEVFQVLDEITGQPGIPQRDGVCDWRGIGSDLKTYKLFKRHSSDPVIVEAAFSANRDGETLLGTILVFRDITERRKAEEQIRQLQKMNSLVLLSVGLGRELTEAHKIIDDALTQLIHEATGSRTKRLLRSIYERSAYQQSVVQQLLTLGRTEPAKADVVDLNEVVAEMETAIREALGVRRSLTLKQGLDLPPIRVNPQDLRQNLLRLIVDARHAMPDGGAIEISTTPIMTADKRQGAQVAIRDTGRGIRTNARERVFDPYYQSRPGNRNPALSLALVYQFVALSGGYIDVESEPGEGTMYLLNFPAAVDSQLVPGTKTLHAEKAALTVQ